MIEGAIMVPAGQADLETRDPPIRVMIVDDSIVARTVLARTLEAERDFAVVAQASNGQIAIDALASLSVDLILLDLEMPGMSGLEALPRLIAAGNGARILVVSAAAGDGAIATVEALRLGAADTLLKPTAGGLIAGDFAGSLVHRLRRIARDGQTYPTPAPYTPAPLQRAEPRIGPIECLAIGASTGGVHALAAFFGALPRSFAAPILVTQHLPAPFMPYFVGQLQEMAGRPAELAASGMMLKPGRVLLAPGDGHIGLVEVRGQVHVRLQRRAAISGCMPSVDPMFAAVASQFGGGGLGVVLSGMGRDGLIGARAIVGAGGQVCVQDAASSTVWGMPGVVADAWLAAACATPAALGAMIGRADARARTTPWI